MGELKLQGIAASPGIAIGPAFRYVPVVLAHRKRGSAVMVSAIRRAKGAREAPAALVRTSPCSRILHAVRALLLSKFKCQVALCIACHEGAASRGMMLQLRRILFACSRRDLLCKPQLII